ncbi:MAG: cytochrome-c oxidase, cbb3-type subunit I [Candidatus Cloacimonadota bacterium]|nr:MAG: cytochrome-c oxidase, cbb3-type subunit I [Candidatus Cloacimonadota bacterium]
METTQQIKVSYDNKIVSYFAWATVIWGIIGMLVGLIIALQLPMPWLNVHEYLTFGRLRPLHTNAVVFAFVGNCIFMGVYYSLQRLCKSRMFCDKLSAIHFWGWQLIIVSAVITLPLGYTTSKEYAELEWPIDIAIAVIWLTFGANLIGTVWKRREKHMYVSIWFYFATFIAITILHVVNSMEIPVSLFKSYSIYAGAQDALVQWWYGHNAVAFFLTTPYLGLMYYFLPKIAGRPVFSYRLSIIHFWSIVFLYMWAGPHHLLFTSVPEWTQTLAMVFSLMLIAPSWGGMLNGLLTLRGAWDRVRDDSVIKFMVVAITCYGMATLEGPLLSIRALNKVAHYTDYIVAHVHVGALGWNGMLAFGILYWLIPRLYNTKIYSRKLMDLHFWMATIGLIFYVCSMYFAGLTQGLMWLDMDAEGYLKYPNFLDTVLKLVPFYYIRAFGGFIYLLGAIFMGYNLVLTAMQGKLEANEDVLVDANFNLENGVEIKEDENEGLHRWLEGKMGLFLALVVVASVAGGLLELYPTSLIEGAKNHKIVVAPYTPLELEGRDVYIKNGCVSCHSQMIRAIAAETKRFGNATTFAEDLYEHPFLWGSKRTGPDLDRIGLRGYNNTWHFKHLMEPESTSKGSIMPKYAFFNTNMIDTSTTATKMKALRIVGVPYTDEQIDTWKSNYDKQAQKIVDSLKKDGIQTKTTSEMVAMIAYLQKLGKHDAIKK